jgi:hypothetical protein
VFSEPVPVQDILTDRVVFDLSFNPYVQQYHTREKSTLQYPVDDDRIYVWSLRRATHSMIYCTTVPIVVVVVRRSTVHTVCSAQLRRETDAIYCYCTTVLYYYRYVKVRTVVLYSTVVFSCLFLPLPRRHKRDLPHET